MITHNHPMEMGRWVTQDEWNEARQRIRDLEEQVTAAWKAADKLAEISLEAQAACAEMRRALECVLEFTAPKTLLAWLSKWQENPGETADVILRRICQKALS